MLLIITAGLVVGPAAHRLQHGADFAKRSARTSSLSTGDSGRAELSASVPSHRFEPAICILCQLVDGQMVLEADEWSGPGCEEGRVHADPSINPRTPAHPIQSRAPPASA